MKQVINSILAIILLSAMPLIGFAQDEETPAEKKGVNLTPTGKRGMYRTDDGTIIYANIECVPQSYSSQMLSIGCTSQLDTYLSPEHYSGWEVRYIGEHVKPVKKKSGGYIFHNWTSQGYIAETEPRSENATDISAMYELSYSMLFGFYINSDFQFAVGGQADAFVGGTYNTRNGNNPAQLHAGLDIAPTAKVEYMFRLFKKNLKLKYNVSAPLLGLQFSPAYGQSYYEIFSEGNYDHNICFTSPLNAASISNRLTVDIPIKKGSIRIGYLGDFRQAKLNDIKSHTFTHGFIIGYTY